MGKSLYSAKFPCVWQERTCISSNREFRLNEIVTICNFFLVESSSYPHCFYHQMVHVNVRIKEQQDILFRSEIHYPHCLFSVMADSVTLCRKIKLIKKSCAILCYKIKHVSTKKRKENKSLAFDYIFLQSKDCLE